MQPSNRQPVKERILSTADRLFYQRGIRAVGVDTIAAEAGISKRSLYDYFPSKEALVLAYLERRFVPLPPSGAPPAEQILTIFDRLEAVFTDPAFRGCPFVNAVAELGGSEAARLAAGYKAERRAWLRDRLQEAGVLDPEGPALQIQLVVEGAIATALVQCAEGEAGVEQRLLAARAGREAVRTLLGAADVANTGVSTKPGRAA
jgi:AcrR family transcriptional regulator